VTLDAADEGVGTYASTSRDTDVRHLGSESARGFTRGRFVIDF